MDSSLVWSIKAGKGPMHHLIGTAHIGEPRTTFILDQALPLLEHCDQFYAESDLDELSAMPLPMMDKPLMEYMSMPHYRKAERMMLKAFGRRLSDYNHIPPIITLQECATAYLRPASPAIDQSLWSAAQESGLICQGLESSKEQMAILKSLPVGWQVHQLKAALSHVRKFKRGVDQMLSAYSRGDIKSLYKQSHSSLGGMRDTLLYMRNEQMSDRIAQVISDAKCSVCFSMGAAHLAGYRGVLRNLKLRDFTLSPLK